MDTWGQWVELRKIYGFSVSNNLYRFHHWGKKEAPAPMDSGFMERNKLLIKFYITFIR